MICRLCGNGPCIAQPLPLADGEPCPWLIRDTTKKSFAPDPRPVKPKKGKKK